MSGPAPGSAPGGAPLLRVRGLRTRFPVRSGVLRRVRGHLDAVDGVDLDVHAGETLGLVGESGSGKTTLALSILRLLEPSDGRIEFAGRDVRSLDRRALRDLRRRMQIVFQDPYGSLNPRRTAGEALEEVLHVHGLAPDDRPARALELLERVGLGAVQRVSFPHELSGGQRQRLAIARALAVEPDLLILDEPVSSLDVSVQAQVLNLLQDLQDELGLAYLFIAHDLTVVEVVSRRVAVMYRGRIVESAPAEKLYRAPRHPYTRALLAAAPRAVTDGGSRSAGDLLHGVDDSMSGPGGGCVFRERCPHPLKDRSCAESSVPLESKAPGHFVACHKPPMKAAHGG